MTNIIESISRGKGITSRTDSARINKPSPGDLIRWDPEQPKKYGRIWTAGTYLVAADELHVCEELGRCFLHDNGSVDISGGPFRVIKKADVDFALGLDISMMWNWGDNLPGGGMGCDFGLPRPVFQYIGPPIKLMFWDSEVGRA